MGHGQGPLLGTGAIIETGTRDIYGPRTEHRTTNRATRPRAHSRTQIRSPDHGGTIKRQEQERRAPPTSEKPSETRAREQTNISDASKAK